LFCYSCNIGINSGVKLNCNECRIDFYYKNKDFSIDKNYLRLFKCICYNCHLAKFGILVSCVDCHEMFYVDKEKKEWKVRCVNCYMKNK